MSEYIFGGLKLQIYNNSHFKVKRFQKWGWTYGNFIFMHTNILWIIDVSLKLNVITIIYYKLPIILGKNMFYEINKINNKIVF